jgi:hypothetical protein
MVGARSNEGFSGFLGWSGFSGLLGLSVIPTVCQGVKPLSHRESWLKLTWSTFVNKRLLAGWGRVFYIVDRWQKLLKNPPLQVY